MMMNLITFYYHIPSAMNEGRWNYFKTATDVPDEELARRAALHHFRGIEDKPHDFEIWIKRIPKGRVRTFKAQEDPDLVYAVSRLDRKGKR